MTETSDLDIEWLVERFRAAGLDVRQRRRWLRDRFVAYTDGAWARVVWSMLGGDRCFIQHGGEITFGEHLAGAPEAEFATWFPVGYAHRFVGDWRRRSLLFFPSTIGMVLFVVPVILTVSDGWGIAVPALAGLLILLALVQYGLRDLDVGGVWLRLGVGVATGTLWALAGGAVTPMTVVGAVWAFTFGNLITIATLGYDRYLFRSELRSVGGPLSEVDTRRLLDEAERARTASSA